MNASIPKPSAFVKAHALSIIVVLFLALSKSMTFAVPRDWNHGCTKSYDENGNMVWDIPETAKEGDLLVLFMSRTDDRLPLELDGWKYAASCFKTNNTQNQCFTKSDCKKRKDGYCKWFPKGNGRDLATIIFFKTLEKEGSLLPKHIKYDIVGGTHPGWGFLLAVNGVDSSDPIRGSGGISNDKNAASVFPSVRGMKGDLLLLSMAFDDATNELDFLQPDGTGFVNFVKGKDEAGYLYSKRLLSSGPTGKLVTRGKGGPASKDALISLVLKGRKTGKKKQKKKNNLRA